MDIEDIRDNYKNFDDYTIENIAMKDANSLRPEVLKILKFEIQKRNLSPEILNGIEIQNRKLTKDELSEYCSLIENSTCSICSSENKKLNISMIGEVVSIIVISHYDKRIKVGCSECLNKLNTNAIIKSSLLGWWGFPWGPIYTIRSYIYNYGMRLNNTSDKPNGIFKEFVRGNVGFLETNKNNPKRISEFLNGINNAI
jgi:hypothetical protein